MTKRTVLNRDSFLSGSTKLKREMVELEDGVVFVRELSGKALLEYNEKIEELKKINPELTTANSLELITLLISKGVCDDTGNLLFTEEDVTALMDNSMNTLKLLAERVMKVSGISQDAIEEAKNTLKNAQIDSSTTN